MAKKEIIGGEITWNGSRVPLSWAVRTGDLVFVSGMVAMDDNGMPSFEGDIAEQTRLALDFMQKIVRQAGCSMEDIAKVSVFLKNRADFPAYNAVYAEYFPDAPPARFTVCTDFMDENCLVELDATVYSPK